MKLLTLDLSTNSTGYAVFEVGSKKLLSYGVIKPKVPGLSKLKYPAAALVKIKEISTRVKDLVAAESPDYIVIEEVNRGINRIAQKSLDALHFFVLDYLCLIDKAWVQRVKYMDSNGKTGWRGVLGIKLSDQDKFFNKESRSAGKKAQVDWKVLAQRYVNSKYKLKFDVKAKTEEADIVDAIALGTAFLIK